VKSNRIEKQEGEQEVQLGLGKTTGWRWWNLRALLAGQQSRFQLGEQGGFMGRSQQQQASCSFLPLLFSGGTDQVFFVDWGGLLTPKAARTRLIWLTLMGRAKRSESLAWISWLGV